MFINFINCYIIYINIDISSVLFVSSYLFCIGLYGIIFLRHNLILLLISLELILLSLSLSFIAYSIFVGNYFGQLAVFFILTLAGSEIAIGLSILVVFYRYTRSTDPKDLKGLRG